MSDFQNYSHGKHYVGECGHRRFFGRDYLFYTGLSEQNADGEHEYCHYERGYLFVTVMPEWVLFVRGARAYAESEYRYHAASSVRKVVHSVRDYSDTVADKADDELRRAQDYVGYYTEHPRGHAVFNSFIRCFGHNFSP